MITMPAHYKNFHSIDSIDDLKRVFPTCEPDEDNWCLLSTSGVHGTYSTLNDIEDCYDNPKKYNEDTRTTKITVLLVRSRIVSILYGHIHVPREDIKWLRDLVAKSLRVIRETQKENL